MPIFSGAQMAIQVFQVDLSSRHPDKQKYLDALAIVLRGGHVDAVIFALRELQVQHADDQYYSIRMNNLVRGLATHFHGAWLQEMSQQLSMALPKNADFIQKNIKLLLDYSAMRNAFNRHDKHKRKVVEQACRVIFANTEPEVKKYRLFQLLNHDIKYEISVNSKSLKDIWTDIEDRCPGLRTTLYQLIKNMGPTLFDNSIMLFSKLGKPKAATLSNKVDGQVEYQFQHNEDTIFSL